MLIQTQGLGRCSSCRRPLKAPSPDGMGPVCRKKCTVELTRRERKEAEGQLKIEEVRT